ncbi:MAG: hypothetical protein HY880_03965 [Deltaproteobacteria bacterium]|nr:hypothetical protein [Deltaproteobacteria bacterium]
MKKKHAHKERLVKITLYLEECHIECLKDLAKEYSKKLGKGWSISALARVAVGDFLTRQGRFH